MGRGVEVVAGGGLELVVGEGGGAVEWEYWVLGERMRATMRIIRSSIKVGLFVGNSGLGVGCLLALRRRRRRRKREEWGGNDILIFYFSWIS